MRSSYAENKIGQTIYDFVLEHKPVNIYEFGVLDGYSTSYILKAIQKRWGRKAGATIQAYDLWEEYEYTSSEYSNTKSKLYKKDKYSQLYLGKKDFYEWIKSPPGDIDMLHLDISNDGDIIELAANLLPKGTILLFEGGTDQRDNVEWMTKYNKRPINDIPFDYTVLNIRFPSISYLVV